MDNKKTQKTLTAQDIYVLGIHDGHNAGCALLKNGQVIAAISEERLTNIKNYCGTPILSIAKVFDIAGVDPGRVDVIAIDTYLHVTPDPQKVHDSLIYRIHERLSPIPLFHNRHFNTWAIRFLHNLKPRTDVFDVLDSLGLRQKPLMYVEHHLAHEACAYYTRPWAEKTLVFTLDGMGDGISATVGIGTGPDIRRIAQTSYFDSVSNNIYSEITYYLGLKRVEHEYKVMGLAPFGDPAQTADVFRSIIRINPGKPLEFENISGLYMSKLQPFYQKAFAHKRFDHIAAGAQAVFEELVVQWIQNAVRETGIHAIACAGGSFLNVKANKLIRELPEVRKAFFYPAADDGGLPVGAALIGYHDYCRNHAITPAVVPITTLFYGQEFGSDDVSEFIKRKKLTKKISEVDARDVAKLLTAGHVIARFRGRDEWGPRALGNRSIMADPRNLAVVNKINFAIKQRDFWMPFAPSILEEDLPRYLVKPKFAPYMIEAFDTTDEAQELVAALHQYDHSARPQTVNDWNPGWQKIIREFKKLTGVGGILNTSFNLHGYPLASSLDMALWTFDQSGLDGLLIDDRYLLRK